MLKVILTAHDGREIKLLHEYISVREALDQFHADCENVAYVVNGISLDGEDLDRKLAEIVKGDEALIVSASKPSEVKNAVFGTCGKKYTSEEMKAYDALMRVKSVLDVEIDCLGTPLKEDELPF